MKLTDQQRQRGESSLFSYIGGCFLAMLVAMPVLGKSVFLVWGVSAAALIVLFYKVIAVDGGRANAQPRSTTKGRRRRR